MSVRFPECVPGTERASGASGATAVTLISMDRPKIEGPWETAVFLFIVAVAILFVIYAGAMAIALLRIVWRLGNA